MEVQPHEDAHARSARLAQEQEHDFNVEQERIQHKLDAFLERPQADLQQAANDDTVNVPKHVTDTQSQFVMKCISANVQKSAENTHQLLERYRDHDVICVQEIFWGHIKNVPSSKNKQGDVYENTTAHQNFVCFGASRMATYVNRK